MHYYQFNIGDYASHTAHLDPIEDIAYRRMLDWCYTHETPLPVDVDSIARLIRMRDHSIAIHDVLNEFFERTGDGWFSSRVQREIDHYRAKVEQASRAGKASAERRLNGRSTDVQPTNNQEPITKNHKPNIETPVGVSEEVWQDFIKHRKAKKAQLTDRVINEIAKQAQIAGWTLEDALKETVVRNWQSFKASWVVEKLTASEERKNTLAALTRGLAVSKPAPKQFWEKPTEQEIGHVEPKRLL